jgi:hypothetical protein
MTERQRLLRDRGGAMIARGLDLQVIDELTGGKLGVHDTVCPLCSPMRKPANRRRRVLRIWRHSPDFASYHCAHCLERGYARDGSAARLDQAVLERTRREAAERHRSATAKRRDKALWLWRGRRPIADTIGEKYLREARGYTGPLSATLGFLPARGEYPPAMIAAFGKPTEPELGRLAIADDVVVGVHLTRLAPDGSGKGGTGADKIIIGRSTGSPIVLAPPNDLLGLGITEGIEDGLSVHEAAGLGAWAAGSASRLPALADAIPSYIESVTVFVDDDDAGRQHAGELAARLAERGVDVRLVSPGAGYRMGVA